ncbi:MAG: N,N-dimethylformamidase [Chloroflexi bacterium]|nr:N,N-dimethylformamidase [Chloroflexota bacterium]
MASDLTLRGKKRSELIGYADPMVVHPGDSIQFMVSTEFTEYEAKLVRLIHGDENPEGPGFKTEAVGGFSETLKGCHQTTYPGSYIYTQSGKLNNFDSGLSIQAWIFATKPVGDGYQTIVAQQTNGAGFGLYVNPKGRITLRLSNTEETIDVSTDRSLENNQWYFVFGTFAQQEGTATVIQRQCGRWPNIAADSEHSEKISLGKLHTTNAPVTIAATGISDTEEFVPRQCFNGKIESPRIFSRPLSFDEIGHLASNGAPSEVPDLVAAWDFSQTPANSTTVEDISNNRRHGEVVNFPMRGLTGHNWTGREFSREAAPGQYGGIHFHDDDVEDMKWDASFKWKLPADIKSGCYAAYLTAGDEEDFITFFVSNSTAKEKIAFLVPTITYLAYANERVLFAGIDFSGLTNIPIVVDPYDDFLGDNLTEYGGSIYDVHSDGSGICYSTARRPIVNMRPKHRHWVHSCPRKLSFDLYLVDWLEEKGFSYDVITDHDLHKRGHELLESYDVVLTGSHPEYWTSSMMDGLDQFMDDGGRLMYLGGNGFYWVTAVDPERDHIIEVRRGYAGSRAWPSHVGELELASNGEIGGIWRHLGRSPNALVGVGFAAQGWDLKTPGYKRLPASYESNVKFIFKGIEGDEVIGDFGLVMSGAAGDELDRIDFDLGTPPQAIRLATSEGMHSAYYLVCHEDMMVTMPTIDGTNNANVRADMVYYPTQKGGAVFSVGSINWLGSLSHNNYDNNVSKITENVLREFCKG